jgi:hypothetical protein
MSLPQASMGERARPLIRWLSPMIYLAAFLVVPPPLNAVTAFIQMIPSLNQWLGTRYWGVLGLLVGVATLVFGGITVLLLKLEHTSHPSLRDHLRQSALWYAFGILHWWTQKPDTIIVLVQLTAILANAVVTFALRRRAEVNRRSDLEAVAAGTLEMRAVSSGTERRL